MSSLKTPIAAAISCLVIYLIRLQWPGLPALWLVLPILSFVLSIRYGNGLAANLFAATIITGFTMIVETSIVEGLPIGLLAFGIAGTMDYFKARLDEATEARTRAKIQLERLEHEREVVDGIFADVTETVQKILSMQRLVQRRTIKFAKENDFENHQDISYIVETLGNAMTLELGYTSIDEAVRRVKGEMGGG